MTSRRHNFESNDTSSVQNKIKPSMSENKFGSKTFYEDDRRSDNGKYNPKKNMTEVCDIHVKKSEKYDSKSEIQGCKEQTQKNEKLDENTQIKVKNDIFQIEDGNKLISKKINVEEQDKILNNSTPHIENQNKKHEKKVNHISYNDTMLLKDEINKALFEQQDVNKSSNLQSTIPDILSTLNKTYPQETNSSPEDYVLETKPSIIDHEVISRDIDGELKQLTKKSLQANQSIYKLAYDENITDQSNSHSPSPAKQDPVLERSIIYDEIIMHEADSGSEAGSEDIELIPHRYESESFLNANKRGYVNKLSLAVELLRTQENLPYDEDFKRVSPDKVGNQDVDHMEISSKVNQCFTDDLFSSETVQFRDNMQLSKFDIAEENTPIYSEPSNEPYTETPKAPSTSSREQDNTDEVKAECRKFGIRFRHYYSSGSSSSSLLNPCLCCILM